MSLDFKKNFNEEDQKSKYRMQMERKSQVGVITKKIFSLPLKSIATISAGAVFL